MKLKSVTQIPSITSFQEDVRKQSTKVQANSASGSFKTSLIDRYTSLHLRAGKLWNDAKVLFEQASAEITSSRILKGLGVVVLASGALYCLYSSRYGNEGILKRNEEILGGNFNVLPLNIYSEKNQSAEISNTTVYDDCNVVNDEMLQKSKANIGESLPYTLLAITVSIIVCSKAFKQSAVRERFPLLEGMTIPLIVKFTNEEGKLEEINRQLGSLVSDEPEKESDILKKKQLAENLSNSLLELSAEETFKQAISQSKDLKKMWASLYIVSSALSMYLLQNLDLQFLKKVHVLLKGKIPTANESLSKLGELIEEKSLFLSNMLEPFIHNPLALAKPEHMVFSKEDKVCTKIPLRFSLEADNFIDHLTTKVTLAFTTPSGVLEEVYKPLQTISDALEKLGYFESRSRQITNKLHTLVKENRFEEAYGYIGETLGAQEVYKASESCQEDVKKTLVEILEVLEEEAVDTPAKIKKQLPSASDTCRENVLKALRQETDIWLEGHEMKSKKDRSKCSIILQDFPAIEDLTPEEWNELASISNDKLREALLEKHIKKVKGQHGSYTWKKWIPKRDPIPWSTKEVF